MPKMRGKKNTTTWANDSDAAKVERGLIMTDQPTAAPTPGDWEVQGHPNDGFPPDIIAKTERGQFGVDIIARLLPDVPKFNGTPEELWANAKLFAGAKATAAERDRLVKVNKRLVKALDSYFKLRGTSYPDGDLDAVVAYRQAERDTDHAVRAALDEARKS